MYLLSICMSSLEKNPLFKSSAHFQIRLLVFWANELYEFLIYFGLTPYQMDGLQIFSPTP